MQVLPLPYVRRCTRLPVPRDRMVEFSVFQPTSSRTWGSCPDCSAPLPDASCRYIARFCWCSSVAPVTVAQFCCNRQFQKRLLLSAVPAKSISAFSHYSFQYSVREPIVSLSRILLIHSKLLSPSDHPSGRNKAWPWPAAPCEVRDPFEKSQGKADNTGSP